MGPQVATATIRTVLSTNRVDLGSFISRCCTFRRTHTSADPIWLLCVRLALPLTLSLLSRFAPNARLVVCTSHRALWLAGDFSCDCKFWDERGGGTTPPVGPQMGTASIITVLSTNPAWTWDVSAHDTVRFGVHARAQTLFGYFVSD